MIRLTVAVSLTLAIVLSAPTHRVVAGMNSARTGSTSNLGGDVALNRMSNGKIAFLGGFGDADGSLDVVNPDGSGLRRLIRCKTGVCQGLDPVWSPDGRQIAFVRNTLQVGGDTSVYVMKANGRGERRVASCRPEQLNPTRCESGDLAWSPDGTRLAFARGGSLYVLDLKTGGMRRLTARTAGAALHPAWSPDGSRIAFDRANGCTLDACPTQPYIVNADGRGLRRLSVFYGDVSLGGPQWSPDGGTIVFSAGLDSRWFETRLCHGRCPARGIYAVNPDGSHLRLLVPAPPIRTNQLQAPAGWSRDGRHILYSRVVWTDPRWPQGGTALSVMNANGTGRRVLYRAGHARIGDVIWSPDGQLIAFSVVVVRGAHHALVASRSGVFVMGADGRHLHRLVASGRQLAWQPIP
jgi:Tol biopolymer transport system component